ncbi:hypothetical protein [Thermococcus thioreducens]|uniref:Uncharacterized protein n=1 Tax=Thermococcus thioreducens TaxID=277988 RepID=A0A0Q2S3T6_9EURY|nr:hypothetical protein [Thermococcus thioreducens]ASJ11811.1 hypothetical protein A3L14_02410 [Thermococcus thioreducens]KQH82147.1 hypothetical protein AMR53_07350 [Thermococcus thioreducens]
MIFLIFFAVIMHILEFRLEIILCGVENRGKGGTARRTPQKALWKLELIGLYTVVLRLVEEGKFEGAEELLRAF